MKHLLVIALLLCSILPAFGNKVDSLRTDEDVAAFVKPILRKNTPTWVQIKTFELKRWEKIDINSDGINDLFAIANVNGGDNNYFVIDKADGVFQFIRLAENSEDGKLLTILKNAGQPLIVYKSQNYASTELKGQIGFKPKPKVDTLIYMYSNFIELNNKPADYHIDSIIVNSGRCYSACKAVDLRIDAKGKFRFEEHLPPYVRPVKNPWANVQNVKKIKPKVLAKGRLSKSAFKELVDLINYMDIKKLSDLYAVDWTDDVSKAIRIKFSDGSTKYIYDYGERGTFGLMSFYQKFYALVKANKVSLTQVSYIVSNKKKK